jgi:hypothetical protein
LNHDYNPGGTVKMAVSIEMKKIFAIVLAIILALSLLTACKDAVNAPNGGGNSGGGNSGGSNSGGNSGAPSGGGNSAPTNPPSNPPATTPSATPSGDADPCPCCPDCIQKECECIECGENDKYDCECKLPDSEYNWRIVGEGEQPFTIPGMMGTNKMIVRLDLEKQGGATPAGTYTGTFYFWHYEMTPELMQASGATGDSYNEFESDVFTVDIVSGAQDNEWLYQTQDVSITVTSVTDVTIFGRRQEVTDYPNQSVKFAFDITIHCLARQRQYPL